MPTTPTRVAVEARVAADDVLREVLLDLEELAVVDDEAHDVAHVVGLVRRVGDDLVELLVHPRRVVGGEDARRRLEVVLGQEREQVARVLDALVLVVGGEVRDARLRVVAHRAAELLELDLLARHRLDDVGAGDEHVRGLLDHEDEVRHGRGVDGAAGARAHDQRDLRDHAGALDVAHEHVAVGAERHDALLDAGAARVVDADHGAADLGRQVHDLHHLLGHHLAERAAEDREVLAEDAHAAALDRAVAGDHGVAPGPVLLHPELVRAVAHEGVELLEGAGVEQLLDPLAGRVLALGVLLLDRGLGRVVDGGDAQLLELGEPFLRGLGALLAHRGAGSYFVGRAAEALRERGLVARRGLAQRRAHHRLEQLHEAVRLDRDVRVDAGLVALRLDPPRARDGDRAVEGAEGDAAVRLGLGQLDVAVDLLAALLDPLAVAGADLAGLAAVSSEASTSKRHSAWLSKSTR